MARWRWSVLAGMVIVLAVVLSGGSPVAGQESLQVLRNEVTVQYPFSVRFELTAESSLARIVTVRIHWRAGLDDVFHTQLLRLEPARTVSAHYSLNAQALRLPPFAEVAYRWEIQDEDGRSLTTETRTFEYVDDRHPWEEIANERLRLLWYGLDKTFAQELFAIADSAYLRLVDYFDVELESRPVVLIYPDREDFGEFQGLLHNVEFVIGRYFPGHNVTANLVTPEMPSAVYEATLAHELSHLFSDHYYVGFSRIPAWLEEGLATYNETPNRAHDRLLVQQAAARGELVPFIALPAAIRAGDVRVTNLAYAEGATVFQFIAETWGEEAVSQFLDAFRRTSNLDNVATELFGLTMAELEMAWRAWLGYPADSVPQLQPTPTLMPFSMPTPTMWAPPG